MEVGEISKQCAYDISMRDYLLGRMEKGDTIVAGVFHRPDSNGHLAGFANENPHYVNAVRNADLYLCDLLDAVEQREKQFNENGLSSLRRTTAGASKGMGSRWRSTAQFGWHATIR